MVDSPVLLDLREILGDEYQEPLAPWQENNDNDNSHMEVWDDHSADDSSCWSYSSSLWEAIYANDIDTARAYQVELGLK